jgi:Ca-activated chloride channel family protein
MTVRRSRAPRAGLVLVLTLAAAGALSAQVFRGRADMVLLNVTVTDAEGRFVSRLDQQDFQVFEDGVLQQITNFTREPQPIALSLLLDTSTSMERRLPVAQEAAVGFVRRLRPMDVAQVVGFNTRTETLQDFTADRDALEHAIRLTRAMGSTALYNAVYAALNDLRHIVAQRPEEIRRQAIIVLSDGEDTSSLIDYDQVMDSAKRSEVGIYTIGLRSKGDAPPHGFNEADFVLRTLAQDTGGRVYHVDDVSQLPAIYQQIADELANQYTMGYTSKNAKRDGAWRKIRVNVNRPATSARTKTGYFAPTAAR